MTVADEQPTPEEEQAIDRLRTLAVDPRPQQVAAIMAAVRQAPMPARRRGLGFLPRLRLAGVTAVAVAALSTGAVLASNDALPNSPAYGIRGIVEHGRIHAATPLEREHLRAEFAAARIHQARQQRGNVEAAAKLLEDGQRYLQDARGEVDQLGPRERGQVSHELEQVQEQEQGAQTEDSAP